MQYFKGERDTRNGVIEEKNKENQDRPSTKNIKDEKKKRETL